MINTILAQYKIKKLPSSAESTASDAYDKIHAARRGMIFDNQTLVSGGHLNNDNALELTYKASDSLMVSVEDTDTSIGKYIESFNGIQGEGWIFFVDGSEAMVSAQYAEINSDSIVHWKII